MSVVDEMNQNLQRNEKELLHFHFRWGHIGLGWTKSLFAEPRDETPLRKTLKSKHGIHRVDITKILCAACKLGKGHRRC